VLQLDLTGTLAAAGLVLLIITAFLNLWR